MSPGREAHASGAPAKVLVTGGAGYVGSLLVPRLLADGHEVVVVDNFMYRQTSLTDCCIYPTFRVVRGDVRDRETIRPWAAWADVLVPLACIVGAPACDRDPWAARSTNLDAVRLLLELARPTQRIIFPTTNSGYGVGEKSVFCTEETPLHPISLYGQLKAEAEAAVLAAGGVTLRFATLFGMSPRMRLDLLVNDFAYQALQNRSLVLFEADFKRNFLHVRDAGAAIIHAMHHYAQMRGQAYNVGLSDANLSKRELCQAIAEFVPGFFFTESPIGEDADKRDYVVSNQKIESTGFRPEFRLADGLRELVAGFQILRRQRFGNV